MKNALAQAREHGATIYDREAAIALRAIERGARALTRPDEPTTYLTLMGRLLQVNHAAAAREARPAAKIDSGSIIIP